MARFLEEEDALAFAGGSGRAHLSSRAEMGPGLVRATRFRQKKGPSIFGKLDLWTDSPESWNRESKKEILAGEFRKVPEQNQGVWEAGC